MGGLWCDISVAFLLDVLRRDAEEISPQLHLSWHLYAGPVSQSWTHHCPLSDEDCGDGDIHHGRGLHLADLRKF